MVTAEYVRQVCRLLGEQDTAGSGDWFTGAWQAWGDVVSRLGLRLIDLSPECAAQVVEEVQTHLRRLERVARLAHGSCFTVPPRVVTQLEYAKRAAASDLSVSGVVDVFRLLPVVEGAFASCLFHRYGSKAQFVTGAIDIARQDAAVLSAVVETEVPV